MKLIFDGLCAAYKKKPVLENVSFAVREGSITALVGRNGAGKSTLIHCLMGEKWDYRGEILLDGKNVRRVPGRMLSHMVACLPQNLPKPHVTVRELVSFGRAPYTPLTGKLSERDSQAIDRAIQAVKLEAFKNAFVDTLSGGERKKAFFAMTLAQDTPLVVLDEPTAHLDTVSRFEFLELLEAMRRQTEKTFLVVMHDLPEVLRCADRIVAIQEGSLVFDGTGEQCLAAEIPQRYFGIQLRGDPENGYAVTPLR